VQLSFGAADNGSVDILYSGASRAISGFQFAVSGMDVSSVSSAASDWVLYENNGKIIGYNFGGDDLALGDGVLVTLDYTASAENSSLSLGVDGLGNVDGALTDDNGNNFATVTFGGDLVHGPADCSGAFGGSLVNDAFGLCDGDGTIHGAINAAESGDTTNGPYVPLGTEIVSPDSAAFIAP
jgi:hypothetical protein